MSVTVKKPAPSWVVRLGLEWAVITINDDTGLVAISSSYGDFTYIWSSIGTDTLLEFVCGLNFDYAMGKFLGTKETIDVKSTLQNFRNTVLDYRRDGTFSSEEARECWNDFDDLDIHDDSVFGESFWETKFASIYPGWYEWVRYEHPGGARMFWNTLWAEFVREVSP